MKPGDSLRVVDYDLIPVPSSLVCHQRRLVCHGTATYSIDIMSCAERLEPKDQVMTPSWHGMRSES